MPLQEVNRLLYLSVGMCVMIGHFSGPYLTVQPSKLKTLFELKSSHSI